MADLSDLKKSLSELNEAELYDLLVKIRASRRTSKIEPKQTKSVGRQPKKQISVFDELSKLSKEDIARIISELQNETNDTDESVEDDEDE